MVDSNSKEKAILTFNALYNLLRNEKKGKSLLQQIDESFYEALKDFFINKKKEVKVLIAAGKKVQAKKETLAYKNAIGIAKEIVKMRSSKISDLAITNTVFSEDTLDVDACLEKEKKYYKSVQDSIKNLKVWE